jgi:PIN domain nuclease of toxin-antitoxin system
MNVTSIQHRDPFDRLLIAQALADGMTMVPRAMRPSRNIR